MEDQLRNRNLDCDMTEAQKLRQEIEYLTAMIGDHKKGTTKGRPGKYLDQFTNPQPSLGYRNKRWIKSNNNDKSCFVKKKIETNKLHGSSNSHPQVKTSQNAKFRTVGPKVAKAVSNMKNDKHSTVNADDITSHGNNISQKEQAVSRATDKTKYRRTVILPKSREQQKQIKYYPTNSGNQDNNLSKLQVRVRSEMPVESEFELSDSVPLYKQTDCTGMKLTPHEKEVLLTEKKSTQPGVSKYKWVSPCSSPVKSSAITPKTKIDSPKNLSFPNSTNKVFKQLNSSTILNSCLEISKLPVVSISLNQASEPQTPHIIDLASFNINSERFTPDFNTKIQSPSKKDDLTNYSSTPQLLGQSLLPIPLRTVKSSRYKIVKEAISPILAYTDKEQQQFTPKDKNVSVKVKAKCSPREKFTKNKFSYVNKSSPSGPVILNKYKLVRRRSSEKFKSTKIKIKELNSIKLSPAQVVKLTSRHKLIKRAIKSRFYISNQHVLGNKGTYNMYSMQRTKLHYPQKNIKPRNYHIIENRGKQEFSPAATRKTRNTRKKLHESSSKYSLRTNGEVKEVNINHLLGRTVENASKDKYKFIKKRFSAKEKSWKHSSPLPYRGRFTTRNQINKLIDRKKLRLDNRHLNLKRKDVHIADLLYQSSRHKLNIRRFSNSSKIYKWRSTAVTSVKQQAANFVVQKSLVTAAKLKKKSRTGHRQYCIFFNRFGKCNRGNDCPYVHDPDKIAVCTRFLRGTCKVTDCPFSHQVAPDKMPVCTYFLRGVCTKDVCPYLHVNVSKDAAVCKDFLNGYCPKGVKCQKRHTSTCPQFSHNGKCQKGAKCPMKHVQRKAKKRRISMLTTSSEDRKKSRSSVITDDCEVPFKDRKLPTYIPLESTSGAQEATNDLVSSEIPSNQLHIIPRLQFNSNNQGMQQ